MIRTPLVVQLLSVACAVGAAVLVGLTGLLDRAVHDRLTRLLERPYAGPVVVVAIDQASLRELEGWPWPRSRHAALVDRLTAAGARVIGLDIDFSSSSHPEEDAALARAVHRSGRVLLAAFKEERVLANGLTLEYANVPLPILAEGAAAVGSILVPIDPDGAVRRASLRDTIGGEPIYAFGLEAARLAAGVPAERLAAAAGGGDLWLDFTAGRPPVVSYADVLAGRVPDEVFRDRIVLVGATALELQDFRATPLGRITPGVQIQAHITDTVLGGGGPRVVGNAHAGLAAVGLALPALLVARGRRRGVALALAGLPGIAGLAAVAAAAQGGVRLPAGVFAVAGIATMLAHGIGAWAELGREVARVRARLAMLAEFGRRA
ncbi:MAG TPA: CHASE2 domain-containing protein, partial [Thermodesulfobacteriota bacterium]